MGILNIVTYIPLLGAVIILFFLRRENGRAIRLMATAVAGIDFLASLYLWFNFDPRATGNAMWQFRWVADWIPSLGVKYDFGIDGISLLLILLTTLMGVIAIVSSFTAITYREKEYYILLLLLQTGMIGTFCALDFFLFYVFWEVMLVPMYFIIGIWGGPRRLYAAIKFFLYTLSGSVLMLLSILALYFYNDGGIPFLNIKGLGNPMTFSVLQYHNIGHLIPPTLQVWIFAGFFFGFAIKVPMFPFHTWLPDAHVEAPTAGSVILAAVLLKMGTYGFVRFALPILPDATQQWLPWIVALSIIGIVYGALVSLVQKDMKKLVAYSSVSHLGFVMLGMFALNPMGIRGSVLQMINHGIVTAAAFAIVGIIARAKRGNEEMDQIGGLANGAPWLAGVFLVVAMAALAIPGSNAFVGEFFILTGVFAERPLFAVLACFGIVYSGVYVLRLYQSSMDGPKRGMASRAELGWRDALYLSPLVIAMLFIALWPAAIVEIGRAHV